MNYPWVRLTKFKDLKFNGKHPNNINVGYVKEGPLYKALKKGESIMVGTLETSVVVSIDSKLTEKGITFSTENSTYFIELIDDPKTEYLKSQYPSGSAWTGD